MRLGLRVAQVLIFTQSTIIALAVVRIDEVGMPKILIADDEPGVPATLKQYFELAQYTVYTARDG